MIFTLRFSWNALNIAWFPNFFKRDQEALSTGRLLLNAVIHLLKIRWKVNWYIVRRSSPKTFSPGKRPGGQLWEKSDGGRCHYPCSVSIIHLQTDSDLIEIVENLVPWKNYWAVFCVEFFVKGRGLFLGLRITDCFLVTFLEKMWNPTALIPVSSGFKNFCLIWLTIWYCNE